MMRYMKSRGQIQTAADQLYGGEMSAHDLTYAYKLAFIASHEHINGIPIDQMCPKWRACSSK